MNTNSFLNSPHLLPVTISNKGNSIHYKLPNDLTDSDIVKFLESEMPGIIIGDYSEHEYGRHLSVIYKEGVFILFEGYYSNEYVEDHYEIEMGIESVKTINSIYDFYIELLERQPEINSNEFEELGIPTPDDLFWSFFKDKGYKKIGQREEFVTDGYGVTTIEFSKDGDTYYVVHPSYDYNPEYKYYSDSNTTVDGYYFTWSAFLLAVKEDNITSYDGYSKED